MSAGSRTRTPPAVGPLRAVGAIVAIKWHLLVGGLRGTTQQRIQTWLAVVFALLFGVLAAGLLAVMGRGQAVAGDLVVVLLPATVLGIALLSAATGVESSLDPRHLATEPVGRWGLGLGVLCAGAVGPPALVALGAGVGLVAGWGRGVAGVLVVGVAVLAWWATLLLASRSLASVLGAVATGRFRQFAQAAATSAALGAWITTQVIARDPSGWDPARWQRLADLAAWTPPGQLGRAIANADRPGAALLHLLAGCWWLPLLGWAAVVATRRLAASAPRPGGGRPRRRARPSRGATRAERWLPGPTGAVARRTMLTKLRTPRQSVNTVTALAVGAGVFFLGPLLLGGEPDPRLVLVGGMLHLAVLFDGNNAFGMDGPPVWIEVSSGVDSAVLVRGKVLSSLTVMSLPAVVVPLSLAALTGGWQWLPAGWLVAVGSVAAAAGVAVLSASIAPVAMPESPNPLAAGDTGQGCVAGLMLMIGLTLLAVVSVPVVVAVGYASTRSAAWTTVAALSSPAAGVTVLWVAARFAALRLAGREAELVQLVTPSR